MAGAATSSDVLAMTMISRLRQSTASAAQRRGYGRSVRSTGVVAQQRHVRSSLRALFAHNCAS